MKVYVQGEEKLIPLQSEVTANSVKNALGYTPADAEDIIDCIEESDDSTLYVTDKDGNIITKTDGEGFHAKAMTVNGKDVESGLVTDEDRESWGGSDLDDVISKDDDSTLYVVDKDNNVLAKIDSEGLKAIEVYVGEDQKSVSEHIEDESSHTTTEEKEALSALSSSDDSVLYVTDKNGDIIAKIDKDGLHATEVYIGNETVADMLADLVGAAPETLNTLEELATAFKEHEEVAAALDEAITNKANATDLKKHEAAFESHKGDSTHLGDEIKLDDDTSLCIVDKDGKIIAKIDGDGLDVTGLKIGSIPIADQLQDLLYGETICTHEYVTIQELVRNTTDCTTWKDLQYCSSCGKVHANLLHTEHTYGEWKVSIPVECEVDGMEERTCIRCDDAETQTIPALGHNMVTVAAQEPTYSSVGWNEHQKCSRCGHTEGYEEIPMLTIYPLTITISQTAYTDPGSGMTTVGNVAGINGIVASQIDASETLVYKVDATYTKNGYLKLSSRSTNCTCTLVCDDETRGIYTLTISNPTGAVTVEIR